MTSGIVPSIVSFAASNTLDLGDVLGLGPEIRNRWAEGLELPRGPVNGVIFYAGEMYPVMGFAEGAFRALRRIEGFMSIDSLAKVGPIMKKLGIYTIGAKMAWGGLNRKYEAALRDAVEVLRALGVEVGYLYEDEPPSGVALHTYGLIREFADHARDVAKRLEELGVRKIITLDPIVATAFKHYYPAFVPGWKVEVEHAVETIARRFAELGVRLRLGRRIRVTFHDPCYLARMQGVVDEVRYIISKIEGVELVEPPRRGINTGCTGDGGLELTQPPLARNISMERIEELKDTGAEVVATACPACILMLRSGFDMVDRSVDVIDLVSLVAEALRNGVEKNGPEQVNFTRYRPIPESIKLYDLSLETIEELLLEETERCKRCGFCNVNCPPARALNKLESRSSRGRMTLINALVKGEPVRPKAVLDRLYSCVLCGQCSQVCPAGLHVQELIVLGRAYAIYSGRAGV